MAGNKDLTKAKKNKKDEFYTQLVDIEKELKYYKEHFKDKVVFCNCDDPYESNFFKYFAMNFNYLGLKKLIATCYDSSPVVGTQLSFFNEDVDIKNKKKAYKVEITEMKDLNNDGAIDLKDVELLLRKKGIVKKLKGDGDFRSEECIELLKEADIVASNPPFSLFRGYVSQLMEYDKKFLIIGNINCLTYKEIFPLIKDNEVWLGNGMGRWISGFIVPKNYELYGTEARVSDNGQRIVATNNCLWLTNLEHRKRHQKLELYKKYNPEEYPRYDNYDAINVDKTVDIPYDYDGVMGVPITFLDKYNPEQFEILDANNYRKNDSVPFKKHGLVKDKDGTINGKPKYARILIRKKGEPVDTDK